jgi:hypothetical protein
MKIHVMVLLILKNGASFTVFGSFSGKFIYSYVEGVLFEFRPGHVLYLQRFLVGLLSPMRQTLE